MFTVCVLSLTLFKWSVRLLVRSEFPPLFFFLFVWLVCRAATFSWLCAIEKYKIVRYVGGGYWRSIEWAINDRNECNLQLRSLSNESQRIFGVNRLSFDYAKMAYEKHDQSDKSIPWPVVCFCAFMYTSSHFVRLNFFFLFCRLWLGKQYIDVINETEPRTQFDVSEVFCFVVLFLHKFCFCSWFLCKMVSTTCRKPLESAEWNGLFIRL